MAAGIWKLSILTAAFVKILKRRWQSSKTGCLLDLQIHVVFSLNAEDIPGDFKSSEGESWRTCQLR